MTRSRPAALALAAALAAAASGCGVPLDSSPQAINRTTVADAAPTPTTTPGTDSTLVQVYFLNEERLEALQYPVAGDPTLTDAISFVLADVPEDSATALHSAVPPQTRLLSARVDPATKVASIDLSSEIADNIRGDTQMEAYAQLVFTAVSFAPDEIEAVTFLSDGVPVQVLTDGGNLSEVTTDDYDRLNPR